MTSSATTPTETDICVIGAGAGGLSVAAGASLMGARVVLVERHRMGGDCLYSGCVPSKALIAAAHSVASAASAKAFGIEFGPPRINAAAVIDHVQEVIASIAPVDSPERYRGFGVDVVLAEARFTGPNEIEAGGRRIRAKRFVIATGSAPSVPPIPGLKEVPYFTNETIFTNKSAISHLVVIGAGPIGLEMAQAHRRLGAEVTVLDAGPALANDDPELVALVLRRLRHEGVDLHENVAIARIESSNTGVVVHLADGRNIEGSHLLVAAGRRPVLDSLNLAAAGVEHDRKGIKVDQRLRSSNSRIYAVGDCCGGPQFTHAAGYQAGIILRNILFRLPAKVDYSAMPHATYTDPELAAVGLSEDAARKAVGGITILRFPFAENDRARAERQTEGMIKVITDRKGRILGAAIAGPHAGELVLPWVLALSKRLKIGDMAGVIAPYPTLSEVSKRAAGAYFTPKLFSEFTRKIVRFLLSFG